jgi:hypothetical protein
MPHQVHGAFSARHVRYQAVSRTNRTPAPSSRAYQPKSTRVERGRHCYAIKWLWWTCYQACRKTGGYVTPDHFWTLLPISR